MSPSFIIIAIFLLGNFISVIIIWSTHLSDEVNPKFISSSYDSKATIDYNSMILKSINKLISKYFKEPSIISKFVGDLPLGNNTPNDIFVFVNESINAFRPDLQAKDFLMMNQDKTELRILQIAKKVPSTNQYDYKYNEVSLYSIPIDNFIINYKNDYHLSKALIKHCWSSILPGRIIGTVLSHDKKILLLGYRVIKGNVVTFRMRYINDLSCNSEKKKGFNEQDDLIIKEFQDYLHLNDNENDAIFKMKNSSITDQFIKNYINNNTYDDIAFSGNMPFSALAVKDNLIAYARELDYYAFSVIQRNSKSNEWKQGFRTIRTNKTKSSYYHTNSLQFITNDDANDIKMVQVYLMIDSSSIYLVYEMIKANFTSNSYLTTQLIRNKIDEDIISQSSQFNLDDSLSKLKKYLKPTIYSNNNNYNAMMEFFDGTVFFIDWNQTGREVRYSMTSSNQIEQIFGDEINENIILMKSERSDLIYFNRKMNSTEYNYNNEKTIVFKSLPNKYRDQIPLGVLIEKFNNKVIMLMLMENGVVLSLDFTKIVEKENTKFWSYCVHEYNYSVIVVIVSNIIFFASLLKLSNLSQSQSNQRRAEDINQLIIDLNHINNELHYARNTFQIPNIINEHPEPIVQQQINENNDHVENENAHQPTEVTNQIINEQPDYNPQNINEDNEEPSIEDIH